MPAPRPPAAGADVRAAGGPVRWAGAAVRAAAAPRAAATQEVRRHKDRYALRGSAVAQAWDRLDRAAITLTGLAGRLTGPGEAATLEAAVAEQWLRDLGQRVASVERALPLSPPDQRPGLEQAHESLAGQFTEREVDLYLPKLKLEYERTLNDDLKALGMIQAFNPNGADFTRMSTRGDLYISSVKQKTYVDVHEEGTEAAAVTTVTMAPTSMPVIPVMRVDRPYLFAIRERFSGTILFVGKIVRIAARRGLSGRARGGRDTAGNVALQVLVP